MGKRIFKWIGIILGIWLLGVAAQIAWGAYREPIAKKEAMDFCATVKVGQSIEGIQERAIASEAVRTFAKWSGGKDATQAMLVIYVGMPPFSRHICEIKASKVVLSAQYTYMD
jgi:hypothetical protein